MHLISPPKLSFPHTRTHKIELLPPKNFSKNTSISSLPPLLLCSSLPNTHLSPLP
ncbi:hypothetical protein HanPI659440_Chr03g0097231 [Helianthus annuus]|nr:hypothetical protein HanPI659440_Chr03g0097231 [Helianthus annuus]